VEPLGMKGSTLTRQARVVAADAQLDLRSRISHTARWSDDNGGVRDASTAAMR
jgi:hypothetical protein